MSHSSAAFNESLLEEELPRSARCGGKTNVLLAFVAGLGLAGLLCNVTMPVSTSEEPSIDMAWQAMQARPLQSMQMPKFRTNALTNPSPIAGSGVSGNFVPDIRQTLALSPAQKCIAADKYASLCGNLVVLRPSTALRAEPSGTGGKTQAVDAQELIAKLKKGYENIEDKPLAALYAGGAVFALTTTSGILASIDSLPLLPSLFETVGLGYSGWFAYRYLLTKSSREELIGDIDELKKKISGQE